ncbi:Acetoin utilization deacetylase AcuC [Dehalogenimonas formicexedens]|uniref:Acetoin utilization deacetylase AcuC n=1 Tax=Dehalogenimonas formicexedens TaxID=1839801 RepID=A0A1P8F4I6_9CHLR|nr:histone deacetylase family protein [Dehalogenimonas formicexedens]APV43379.1 Acetoin utilization deacetylase AcuC [Dehalogenimonas formicexedens]
MFRVRRILDDTRATGKQAVAQVQQIMRDQFPKLLPKTIAALPHYLRNPVKYGFRSVLFVADDVKGNTKGFALMSHDPELNFAYLDYLSAARGVTGQGVGGALYERVREEASRLGVIGLFFEALPDDARLSKDPRIRKQNAARLRFYERFGAFPIANTRYETPIVPGGDNPPLLVFDGLGNDVSLPAPLAKSIVRAILERKYGDILPEGYVDRVVESFKDDPVKLRPSRYLKGEAEVIRKRSLPVGKRIVLIVNDKHAIHHVKEIGYVEAPVRIDTIMAELDKTSLFYRVPAVHFGEQRITAVHDAEFFNYFKRVCSKLEPEESVYPYVFPIRNAAHPPEDLAIRAGYYCIDTFTPINRNAFLAARRAVDCSLTGAKYLLEGTHLVYALVRPPGHHAERRAFGGFCYFNSAAAAAQYLSPFGTVAILDIDYHHGNGQQVIFYSRRDVLTISIHCKPSVAYPYFSGFASECGEGEGVGFNINYSLPEKVDGPAFRIELKTALTRIKRFRPQFLVVALGLDTARNDPTGTWDLLPDDFEANGRLVGALGLPTLVVQEGGYDTQVLGINARRFFTGLWSAAYE